MDPNQTLNHALRNCSACCEGIAHLPLSIRKLTEARDQLEAALHQINLMIEEYRGEKP